MSKRQILNIRFEELRYLDEDERIKSVRFVQCYENYLKKELAPAYLEQLRKLNDLKEEDLATLSEQLKEWKEVGVRGGKFIEFYADPPVRFRFETLEEYEQVKTAVLAIGWQLSIQVE